MKIEELKNILGDMPSIPDKDLNPPIISSLVSVLHKMFDAESDKCINISLELISQAKKDGKNFLKDS